MITKGKKPTIESVEKRTKEILSDKIEDAFKLMKNPHFLSWSPQFHWTDQKIMVHTFYCILALTLCSLLCRELSRNKVDISIPAMLEELTNINEVLTTHGKIRQGKKQRQYLTVTDMNEVQQKMFDTFNLKQYN